jgi:hypothetical protein
VRVRVRDAVWLTKEMKHVNAPMVLWYMTTNGPSAAHHSVHLTVAQLPNRTFEM